jgi:hypothetical protein
MNKKRKKPEDLEEYVNFKQEFEQQYKQKKMTQKQAKERRRLIREMKEDQEYWN